MKDCTVVIPVYKEDSVVVTKLYQDLKKEGYEVVIVDDGSQMDFPEGVNTISYRHNVGYGHALKTGIQSVTTSTVITADGDGQHTVEDINRLYQVYTLRTDLKMVVGQRWLPSEPFNRWVGRKALNFIGSIVSGHYLSDMNSGLRVINTKIAQSYSPILCDTFSFTTSLSISMVSDGHKIAYYPIDVQKRVKGKSHVKLVRDGLITLFYIFYCGIGCRTRNVRRWLRSLLST